jgi:hypothetical protein
VTTEQAGRVLARLVAGFPREALEPASAELWIAELSALPDAEAAVDAASEILHRCDEFPTLRLFRDYYRTAIARGTRTLPVASAVIRPRPLLLRLLRHYAGMTPLPVTDAERHDAILVLRDTRATTTADAMHVEAQRIMDEASA